MTIVHRSVSHTYHIFRYVNEEKDVVILKKEVPKSPFHWLEFTYTIGLSIIVFFQLDGTRYC